MNDPETARTRRAVAAFLEAIESRDVRALRRTLAPDATWQNVPHASASGRDDVVAFLAGILTWADEVRWDVVSSSYVGRRAWLERIDRFHLDGEWFGVSCNGIIDVDDAGLVQSVRDYVDLGEWRGTGAARSGPPRHAGARRCRRSSSPRGSERRRGVDGRRLLARRRPRQR